MTNQAAYKRHSRVRNGQQKTVPIPTPVLADAIQRDEIAPLVEHLGPDMVGAVLEAAAETEREGT